MAACTLCPRMCGADRENGELGFCGMPAKLYAARAALHVWEEPPISGERGSGAVFFSGCSLGCGFCQNSEISQGRFGKEITTGRLREIFMELIAQGAHNINLVTPTHFLPKILPALEPKLPVPVVYNCGGYERVETLRLLEGKADVYLPDLKFAEPELAKALCGAEDYFPVAARAIDEMLRQVGPPVYGPDGMLKRGVIIRHLVLPGQAEGAKQVMDWVAREFPKGTVLFSLMSQYTPYGRADQFPEIDRKLRRGEIRAVQDYMDALGLDGFTQERTSAKREYTPPFDLSGI